jgi:hypothetical protein
MSAMMSQPPELTEEPNKLEKKVDLLVAMLVDEQLLDGGAGPGQCYGDKNDLRAMGLEQGWR